MKYRTVNIPRYVLAAILAVWRKNSHHLGPDDWGRGYAPALKACGSMLRDVIRSEKLNGRIR